MTRLSDCIDLSAQTELDNSKVEAYGFKEAPVLRAEITSARATEYVLKYDGRVRRVYNHEQENGNSRMYIKTDGGTFHRFVTEEVEAMLTRGNPSYEKLTPVASSVVLI